MNKAEIEELKEKAREAQRKLAKHRIQTLLLMQVRDQLVAYKNYAQAKTTPDKKEMLLAKYNKLIGLISGILADKKLSKTDEQLNESDDVYRTLKSQLEQPEASLI